MRLVPGSPRPLPLLAVGLALALTALLPHLAMGATPFPQDLEPISIVGREHSYLYPASRASCQTTNDTVRLGLDFQRMLRINHMLYIAARDNVFAVSLSASSEQIVPQQKLTWKTKDVDKCTVRGKNSDECYNYIKVLVPRNDETLFACGTNAFNPTCRNYKMSTLEQDGEEVVGQARCPFESRQSNVGLFAGGDFYSATMTDFLASDAVIYRSLGESSPVLRTVKYDSKWLREPHFLHAIEYGNYVYFFFSEIAVEYTTLGKVYLCFSRVARLFQSLTNVLQINHRPGPCWVSSATYPAGVLHYTANVSQAQQCVHSTWMTLRRPSTGKFKEQRNSESAWTPVPEEQVPKPDQAAVAGDGSAAAYKSFHDLRPDDTLTFIKNHPLMDEAVPLRQPPALLHTHNQQVQVDPS
ncbi:hypothetical protein J4Q44_G00019680 [Coregonus suidteri]|uniref:Sema domain-containing protein n=1 Tax=Coregonus suidteri TaxID=861788 RepID=A0AAN8M8W3_9TELE